MKATLTRLKIWVLIWWYKNLNGYGNISVKLLYSQAWHETGNFKSPVYEQNKNLFGMRHPSKRKTLSLGSNLSHARYKSHKDSIVDYFYRQQNFRIANVSDEQYMEATVKSNYAEDKNYYAKWKAIYLKMKLPVDNKLLYMVGLFFLVVIVYKFIRSRDWSTQKDRKKDSKQQTININTHGKVYATK
ncbi:mannosyl-glycoprotein endo-beta-N-acetylglucosaminidase [Cellulophaga phage phi12:2]|uniref:Mannosyl-glycoprotein endo-beta-N-acetylglucosaminidase n=1 Tax=Cellulophaga phage phi12:2 TaxID=1327969 RepID=R9ZXN3_9VIRU|nr:mannosyl-glycoprotein endo-beta-N-acetylglucosaminidase [Cellulophaga phage phi12:2]AGO47285.1 mannosyl-glycoprotein endo-beta-N-acetylglucosaminidase [Cellulophaga phage phi12:2]